jgi:hypothetical protein
MVVFTVQNIIVCVKINYQTHNAVVPSVVLALVDAAAVADDAALEFFSFFLHIPSLKLQCHPNFHLDRKMDLLHYFAQHLFLIVTNTTSN